MSDTNHDYISRELYEAGMAEIRALFQASIERQENLAAQMRLDTENRINALREQEQQNRADFEKDNIKREEQYFSLEREIKNLRDYVDARISRIEIILSAIAVILTVIQFFK